MQLEKNFNSEINTMGYPKAALFGFCVALVAYNTLAVIHGAIRAVHSEEAEQHVSGYYLASELSAVHDGMMIALPAEEWAIFRQLSCAQMAIILVEMIQHIRLAALKKHKRGPKKTKGQTKT